jgi:hypothetical protein
MVNPMSKKIKKKNLIQNLRDFFFTKETIH